MRPILRNRLATGLLQLLLLVMVLPACAEEVVGETEDATLARLQLAEQDLSQELLQVERDILDDRRRLQSDELNLRSVSITPALLEDARLEQAALNSRESGLKTRLKARRVTLNQLRNRIDELALANELPEVEKNELLTLQQRRVVLEALIEKLERLHKRYEIRASFAKQRLNLLQARFEMPDLEVTRKSTGQAGAELQQQVDQLLLEATSARREAAILDASTGKAKARRRLLEMQALIAEERAEFHQLSIERIQITRVLQSLSAFSGSDSMPLRVLKTALQNLGKMDSELNRQQEVVTQKRSQLVDQRQILDQQGPIVSGVDSTLSARLALIDELTAVADTQLQSISDLAENISVQRQDYQVAVTAKAGSELMVRRELPVDGEAWKQLGRNLVFLPVRVALSFKEALTNLVSNFGRSDPGTQLLCFLLLVAVVFVGWQGRRLIARQLEKIQASDTGGDSATWVPLTMLHRNLLTLLPPIFVFGIGMILKLPESQLVLLLAPILIWPVVRFSLDFINNLLDEYTPELDREQTRLLLMETRWVVIVAAVLAAVLVTAHSVALSQLVIDAIERLAMVGLLLMSLPLIHLRRLLLQGVSGDVESRFVKGFTLATPLLLVLCALIGVVGYVNLAWGIAVRLGWLVVVGLGVHLARLVLRGVSRAIVRWLERRDAESAVSWEQFIVAPIYRLSLLLVVIVAANWLFALYEWNAQTPIVSAVPQLLDTTLFTVGETAIKLETLGLAILTLFVAFWGAGWSKQVSYRWLYTGVQDQGIRSSLSTFTQYIVVVLGLLLAMEIVGLDMTAFTVFAGALGVGIGFGMQTIVVNFISGILLLVERPLSTTDLVNVDKYEGEVTRIGIRSLTVKTFDNQEVIIPNSAVITQPFTNWTRSDDVMRTVLMVGISYDDDPHEAVKIVLEKLKSHDSVLTDPGPKVLFWEFGDSALMLRLQFHTQIRGAVGRADVRSQLLFAIWDAFKEAGITIPYPQRDVHIHQAKQPGEGAS